MAYGFPADVLGLAAGLQNGAVLSGAERRCFALAGFVKALAYAVFGWEAAPFRRGFPFFVSCRRCCFCGEAAPFLSEGASLFSVSCRRCCFCGGAAPFLFGRGFPFFCIMPALLFLLGSCSFQKGCCFWLGSCSFPFRRGFPFFCIMPALLFLWGSCSFQKGLFSASSAFFCGLWVSGGSFSLVFGAEGRRAVRLLWGSLDRHIAGSGAGRSRQSRLRCGGGGGEGVGEVFGRRSLTGSLDEHFPGPGGFHTLAPSLLTRVKSFRSQGLSFWGTVIPPKPRLVPRRSRTGTTEYDSKQAELFFEFLLHPSNRGIPK